MTEFHIATEKRLRASLKAGMKTNLGTFTHWDDMGNACFDLDNGRKGWTGRQALFLIQILNK